MYLILKNTVTPGQYNGGVLQTTDEYLIPKKSSCTQTK